MTDGQPCVQPGVTDPPTSDDARKGAGPSHRSAVLLGLILVGAVLRIGFFALDTWFWGDEAALALNFKTKTFSQFLLPLDHYQHAPVLYVLLEKSLFEVFGPSEHGLRLPSLLASLLSLPLFFGWCTVSRPCLFPSWHWLYLR